MVLPTQFIIYCDPEILIALNLLNQFILDVDRLQGCLVPSKVDYHLFCFFDIEVQKMGLAPFYKSFDGLSINCFIVIGTYEA